ncbi:MAG: hypothetical protein IPM60_17420 [Rhodospirillales bacterium]|nr:hypothetical protein [Rhodospirillales bacterium]
MSLADRLGAVSLAILVGACANSVTTGHTYRHPAARNFAQGVMVSGPLLIEVRGDPYAVERAERDAAVLAATTRAFSWNARPRLTTDPDAAGSRDLRLVMGFNAGGGGGRGQCLGRSEGGEPLPEGAVDLQATLCDADVPLSNAYGRLPQSMGLEDPAFANLIWLVVHEAFPREMQRREGGMMLIMD